MTGLGQGMQGGKLEVACCYFSYKELKGVKTSQTLQQTIFNQVMQYTKV